MKWLRHRFQPCLPLGPGDTRISGCKEHIALSREAAREGIVLLKNENNVLPFRRGQRVVLLGKASEEYIKGGGGSGDVSTAYVRNLYDSMLEKENERKIQVYTGLHSFYQDEITKQYAAGTIPGMTMEPTLSDEQLQSAAAFSDVAVFSICRFSGEGWDRHCAQQQEVKAMEMGCDEGTMRDAGKKVFGRGDFYLSDGEAQLFARAKQYFKRIIVVLNVGGMVDTTWLKDDPTVCAAVFAGQGGMEGAMAVGDILCGDANPCGRLTDTFARSLEAYPSTPGFHASEDYVEYQEDIYVGYRYFETIPRKKDEVVYPFGYGLSYTDFTISVRNASITDGALTCDTEVLNDGTLPGKEVVQLYFSAPQGRLGKPEMQLCAFEKTVLLQPGEKTALHFSVPLDQLSSYDDLGAVCKSAWILEKGTYRFFIGKNVRENQALPCVYELAEDHVVRQCTEQLKPLKLSRRLRADGTWLPMDCDAYEGGKETIPQRDMKSMVGTIPETCFVDRAYFPFSPLAKPEETQLESVADGKLTLDGFLNSLTLEEQVRLLGGQPNTGVANTFGMGNNPRHGIPNIMTADGPAGLRLHQQLGVYTTAWPCATLLACTWNRDLVEKVGAAGAKEVKENNIGIWLTPALNIHRSPLCGRNFEYYSEDPLVAGEIGAAMVKGIQSQKIAATPKHFAFNNKETNRSESDSRVSERAAREIYLKGFEIIVRKAKPRLIMTSYNCVNGKHTSANKELLTGILRGEWGFDGLVTTDWWTHEQHAKEIKAGNDVKMACGFPEDVLSAIQHGVLDLAEVRACARRVLEMILWLE